MTTKDRIAVVKSQTGIATNEQAKKVIEAYLGTIISDLERGEDVAIAGFGIFRVKGVQERWGRNPQTGDDIRIPAHKKVVFKAAKALVEKI